jgi:hypothetical protein
MSARLDHHLRGPPFDQPPPVLALSQGRRLFSVQAPALIAAPYGLGSTGGCSRGRSRG